jgi:hypothetical protein
VLRGLTPNEALYEWNYQRKLLAIRLAESHHEVLARADLFSRASNLVVGVRWGVRWWQRESAISTRICRESRLSGISPLPAWPAGTEQLTEVPSHFSDCSPRFRPTSADRGTARPATAIHRPFNCS